MAAKLVKQFFPRDSNSEEEQPDPESMERCSDGAKARGAGSSWASGGPEKSPTICNDDDN